MVQAAVAYSLGLAVRLIKALTAQHFSTFQIASYFVVASDANVVVRLQRERTTVPFSRLSRRSTRYLRAGVDSFIQNSTGQQ